MRFKILLTGILSTVLLGFVPSYGQSIPPVRERFNQMEKPPLERMFYSLPYKTLEEGVLETSRRHALYSYLIANFATAGFDFYSMLPNDDKRRLDLMLPNRELDMTIFQEFILARYAENSRKYSALITLWGGKKNSLSKVVTLGK